MAKRDDSPEAVVDHAIERHLRLHGYSPAQQIRDFGVALIRAQRRRAVRIVRAAILGTKGGRRG